MILEFIKWFAIIVGVLVAVTLLTCDLPRAIRNYREKIK